VSPSIKKDANNKIVKPKRPVNALIKLISKSLNCLEKTWANAKASAIRLAKNNPKKLSTSFGSKNIIKTPINAVKIKNHFFGLIFSFKINALAKIPKGIANCEPTITGEIIDEWYNERVINTYTKTPIDIEKVINEGKYFFSGILNFQKGININNTSPILSEAIRIGGTESFKTSLVNGKALPWATAIKSKINKCFKGNLLSYWKRI